MARILIVGGYGAFGALAAERLARDPGITVIICGRNAAKAETAKQRLEQSANAKIESAVLDATADPANALAAIKPNVVINASGPFQEHGYALAQACIACRAPYIDLADARTFVTGITRFDDDARQAGVCVISGASTVPALTSAVYMEAKSSFSQLRSIETYLSPGNHFNPGEATTRSVLSGAGCPLTVRRNGRKETAYGWMDLSRRTIPGIGARWFGNVDVPDLDLFPQDEPDIATVTFQAGVEVSVYHLGLWALAGLKRTGLLSSVAPLTRPLMAVRRALPFLGSDRGGMMMVFEGLGQSGKPLRRTWSLAAIAGDGPYIPATAGVLLARKLAQDSTALPPGAKPCFGLLPLEEFVTELSDLKIATRWD